VIRRQATGQGQKVETSLLASLVALLSVQGQRYLSLGDVPAPVGNVHPVIAPYGVFEAQDGPLNIGSATQEQWLKLARLLGLEHLAGDARFLNNAARIQHRMELKALLEQRLRLRPRAEWTQAMVAQGIPAGPINRLDDVFADPQVQHCRMVETIEHPELGALRQVGNPVRMDGLREGSMRLPPPLYGQHTVQVLQDMGYARSAIDGWLASGVVAQHRHGPGE
jgi:crotonobetainyl-CoA:carnitine CoA-transferase CaiB-like acyl-CoA transferase